MSRQFMGVIAVELALVATSVLLLSGGAGNARWVAVASGAVLMAAFAIPSLMALLWGRGRSHAAFLSALGGVVFAKMALVGAAVFFVLSRTELRPLEFIMGMLAGWLAGFAVQAKVLRSTLQGTRQDGAGS